MADKDIEKAQAEAREADQKRIEAEQKAADAEKSKEQRAAEKAQGDADRAQAEAQLAEQEALADATKEPTTVVEAKNLSAVADPERKLGDHHAQKFSNDPENPQLAPHLDPEAEGKVKLVMETSDTLAAGRPNVTWVHPEMVGDYIRAGWSKAVL